MDPVTIALFFMAGCALLLGGCGAQKEENETFSLEWEPIPEEKIEIDEENDSQANNNMTLKCICSPGNETTLKSTTGYDSQGGILGTEADIEFYTFKECKTSADKLCKPEIEGKVWKCPDQNHTVNENHTVSCETFMFCLYGIGIVYIKEDGQVQGKEFLGNYVIDTVTGARLILNSSMNPQGIPLYSGKTLNGKCQYIPLKGDLRAGYEGINITTDDAFQAGSTYNYIHPLVALERYKNEPDKLAKLGLNHKNVNYNYHGSFSSIYNKFSIADNRIEVAMCQGVLCVDGEPYTSSLAGKYIDVELEDGTVLACIVGDAKGNETGSSSDGIFHHDNSFMELLGTDNKNAKSKGNVNSNKADILHGQDVVGIYVYEEKRLYDEAKGEYTYYFSDYNGDMSIDENGSE